MTQEIWKPVIGYEGIYEVSNMGRVKSLPRRKVLTELILKPNIKKKVKTSYYNIGLSRNNHKKKFYIHRLVAQAFLGDSPLSVNHVNGDGLDNRIENLEYVSNRENTNHMYKGKGKYLTGVDKRREEIESYKAVISINGKRKHLGTFDTELEAHHAYLSAARELKQDRYSRPQPAKTTGENE